MLRNAYRAVAHASPARGSLRTAAGAVTAVPAEAPTVQRLGVVSVQRRQLHASACAQASAKGGAAATRQSGKKNSSWFVTRSLIPTLYSMDGKQGYIDWPYPQLPMRRQMKGRIKIPLGGSLKGTRHRFGPYGIAADTEVIYTQFQLEAAKEKAKRILRGNKQAHVFMRVFACVPRTKKAMGARMGKGKGAIDHFVARVPKGRMVMEIGGNVEFKVAKEALRQAAETLPGKLNFKSIGENPREALLAEAKKALTLHPIIPPFAE